MKKKQIIILAIIILFFAAYLTDREEKKEADKNKEPDVTVVSTSESTTELVQNTEKSEDSTEESTEDDTELIEDVPSGLILSDIPSYSTEPYVEVNNNIPYFTSEEKSVTDSFEKYSELDSLGRCGVAYANLCRELMPTEERGEIGDIRPSGWHTVKYNDLIEGNYLYNRCHLIAYSLAGENANPKNLITGTRYLNTVGMLSFEIMVANYIERSDNHVLYRVTPVFEGDNLVASGVEIEGWSVEDDGAGICFNVFCYNVQPYIDIDYLTGDSCESADAPSTIVFDDTEDTTEYVVVDRDLTDEATSEKIEADYVVNTNSRKIHLPTCSSVDDMAEHNKWYYVGSLDDLKEQGYTPCKRCLKGY
ncbi:MAG: DNA/RNA non-specific endonuclease [Eubacterium sp.]|nr:DNA/RNA non-specific endonuclease [Eubacterium sp.]